MHMLPVIAIHPIRTVVALFCILGSRFGPPLNTDDTDSAIYAAVLNQLFVAPDTRQLVVLNETTPRTVNGGSQEELAKVIRSFPAAALSYEDFVSRNATAARVGSLVPTFVPVRYIAERELLSLGGGSPAEYWARFRDAYPRAPGYVVLSRPGYSPDRSQALLYVYSECGPRCRSARYVILRRDVRGWRVGEALSVE